MIFRRPQLFRLCGPGRACRWLVLGAGLGLLGSAPAFGQTDSLPGIARRLVRYTQQRPTEKLYLHLDRPSYTSGETMWLKLYAVAGGTHQPLPASKVAYVELLDGDNVPVLQTKLGLEQAMGRGSLVLPAALASGRYTVRAYTRWMQNAGPAQFFHATVAVVNTRQPSGPAAPRASAAFDAQFFPEGGYLVQGLPCRVGFKITDASGRGVAAEGTVVDEAGTAVAQFKTLRFGLGSFAFAPTKAGAAYKAVIRVAGQSAVTTALPVVQEQGYGLALSSEGADQLQLTVRGSGPGRASETVFLLGHNGQQVHVAATAQLHNGEAHFSVATARLTAGVSHFTLFNSRRQPVCERLYFRPPAPQLAISGRTDKLQYFTREKVALQLGAAGPAGQPLPASLSVAVYQLDSLSAGGGQDIASYLWLTSDLRGAVESPHYYLTGQGPEVAEATDNLMLTQGWSRFRWAEVLAARPDSLAHLPELNGHLVRGRVVHRLTGAPAPGIPLYLTAPSRRVQLHNAVSKADGSVHFEVAGWYGPKQLVLQPHTKRDTLYRVELLNPFSTRYADARKPAPLALAQQQHWAGSLQRRHVQAEVQQHYSGSPAAVYTAPRPADTLAFYGTPNERYRLDDFTRFKVMEEVMREYVPGVMVRRRKDGFHFLVPNNNTRVLSENPLVLLDGMPVFDVNKIMAFDPLKVQRLDVLTTRYVLGPQVYNGVVSYTTYKGDLAGFPLDPHALLLDYEGLQGQREFYAPRYDTPQARQSRLPDLRNLLYWNPDVSTSAGTLTLASFFTSDQTGKYRVVVQGLSPTGLAGSTSFTLEVKPAL